MDINKSASVPANEVTYQKVYQKVSNEKRKDLIRLVFVENYTIAESARMLEINYGNARKIIKQYETENRVEKNKKGGSEKSALTTNIVNKLEEIIAYHPEFTLKEMKLKIEEYVGNGFTISQSSICKCLQELRITLKLMHHEIERVNEPDILQKRKEYSLWFNNYFNNDYSGAVFIDEAGFNLHLRRSYARARRGERANIRIPTVRGRSITLIASMMNNGMKYCKIISNSTVNADIFSQYVNDLCAYLRDVENLSNACLILDNARIHRKNDIERITNEFGYTYKFLSPYSYMLNPIENSFSKIKNGVRSSLRNSNDHALADLIMEEVGKITRNDSLGFFRHVSRNITNCAAEMPYCHQ